MTLRLVRLAGLAVSFAVALLVAACSSLSGGQLTSMPDANSAQYGTGAIKVGLLTRDQSDDLGEGAPDSAFLAAQLDAETLAKSPITLVVRRYDGSFSAEHGIGRLKPYMMPDWRGGAELALMQRIKAAIDPAGIMNPGKVLPEEPAL